MPIILRATCHTPIATLEEAAGKLAGVAACFADRIGGLWTHVQGRHVSLDGATASFVLDASRVYQSPRRPGGPTHHIPFVARPGHAPVGACEIRVASGEAGGAAFALRVAFDAPLFELDPESLLALSGAIADAMPADEVTLRPAAWANGPGSWAVLTRASVVSRGGVSRRCRQGMFVVLHDGAPTDEAPEAKRRSEEECARVFAGPELPPDGMAVSAPARAVPFAQPTYLGPPSPPVVRSAASLGGTSLAVEVPRGPTLPFASGGTTIDTPRSVAQPPREQLSGTLVPVDVPPGPALPFAESEGSAVLVSPMPIVAASTRESLSGTTLSLGLPRAPILPFGRSAGDEALASPRPGVLRAPEHLSGTALSVEVPRGAALPFARSKDVAARPADALAVPVMSVEGYALFRARLSVRGENDPETLREYGVTSKEVKDALQGRFAARFKEDPDAQSRFIELFRGLVSELRGQAAQR